MVDSDPVNIYWDLFWEKYFLQKNDSGTNLEVVFFSKVSYSGLSFLLNFNSN